MPLSKEVFTQSLLAGVQELDLTLTGHQVDQFFFICTNCKNGIAASI
ncbi:hypothetical protein U27_05875 [Candidatus Vecturithrix granuli]|uniref:Uncharacterized protein n=1 Tax=Vecturithrix granuli TaxID=1499967 RepID=A0A081C2U5_VECG1|nr:hypothetical protein U27_05875 [Candidatus Vecturithrix granuli]